MHDEPDPLLSLAAAATQIGVNRSTLSRQVRDGQVRSHKGKVRLSEVLEDRARNIDLSRSRRRNGALDRDDEEPLDARSDATAVVDATPDPDAPADDEQILVDGAVLPFKEARALKETYLARLRRLQFQRESGEFISIEDVARVVTDQYSVVRNRLLALPAQIGNYIPAEVRPKVVEVAQREVHQALEELSADARYQDEAAQPRSRTGELRA